MNRLSQNLHRSSAPSSSSSAYRRGVLTRALHGNLDRVNVLGDDARYGHSGCVNALSWAHDGDVLLSGGDDRTVMLWRMDPGDTSSQYPYRRTATIQTGHTANIFNAQLLPTSSRMATVAGDGQVRVFDIERPLASLEYTYGMEFMIRETCRRVFTCHSGPTKRIVTEDSPDLFLTVAEDGCVRQHDLRNPHSCRQKKCPPALIQLNHELSTLALSPLSPHLFVVAGQSAFGYLFDRRQTGRTVKVEWGVPCREEHLTTCVRRFGRGDTGKSRGLYEHITGARMAKTNGHEVLLSYSNDGVYLYSIYDDPEENISTSSVLLPPNKKHKPSNSEDVPMKESSVYDSSDEADSTEESESLEEELTTDSSAESSMSKIPTVLPRKRYGGHCNTETVKDVNFIGPEDEFVASGSDDGNFFLWEKASGKLHGIYEGDGAVVNVIEQHPRLPLIACSGIDTTVKLFAPTTKPSKFSRMENAEQICGDNGNRSRRSIFETAGLARLLWQYRMRLFDTDDDDSGED